jgi:hypothetical protein
MARQAWSTNYEKVIDPSSANIIDPGLVGGKVRVMTDNITIPAASTLGSTDYVIVGTKLPTGSMVVGIRVLGPTVLSSISSVNVGDEGDLDRYIALGSAVSSYVQFGPAVATGMNYQVTGTTDNYIRVQVPNGREVSSGTIKVSVEYVVE